MDNKFAEVTVDTSSMRVTVLRSKSRNDEFSKLVDDCEKMYMSFRGEFVLAMDLQKMSQLDVFQSLQWMAMFFRVRSVTKKYLRCTCVCFTPELNAHVQKFLDLYDPIRPFYTFHEYNAFQDSVQHNVRNCAV